MTLSFSVGKTSAESTLLTAQASGLRQDQPPFFAKSITKSAALAYAEEINRSDMADFFSILLFHKCDFYRI